MPRNFLLSVVTDDSTGKYSCYTKFHGREIMFHVSTLLPWTPNNKQQVHISTLPRLIHVPSQIHTRFQIILSHLQPSQFR